MFLPQSSNPNRYYKRRIYSPWKLGQKYQEYELSDITMSRHEGLLCRDIAETSVQYLQHGYVATWSNMKVHYHSKVLMLRHGRTSIFSKVGPDVAT